MLVHLYLSVLLTVISLIAFICTITYELINDDDDDDDELRWKVFTPDMCVTLSMNRKNRCHRLVIGNAM